MCPVPRSLSLGIAPVRFGLFSLMTQRSPDGTQAIFQDTQQIVGLAEDIGFETAWFAEHHFSNYSVSASPLLMAARFAGSTRKIKLGTGVVVLPLYEPIRLIEEIGLVDSISDGRLVLGLGTGYQQYEFQKFRSPYDEKVERSMELIDLIEMGLSKGELTYQGKHYSADGMPICARTPGGRKPEIFVAGTHPALLNKAAQLGYTPLVGVGYKGRDALVQKRAELSAIFGKNGGDWPMAVQRYVYVTDDKQDARDAARQILYVNRLANSMRINKQELDGPMLRELPFQGEPSIDEILANCIVGDAHLCAERLADEITAVRPTEICCFIQIGMMDGRRAMKSLEKFGSEVIPLLERSLGRGLGDRSTDQRARRVS